MRQLPILLLVLFLLSVRVHPQKPDITFRHLSIEDGLSQISVESIVQDHAGFMWIGTEDGLNRYDGYNFKVYKHDPEDPNSISNNDIWCLYVDRKGILWIGTFSGGLNRFDPKNETFTRYFHISSDSTSISSNLVRAICEDHLGNIWVGTRDSGINILDPENRVFKNIRHDPKDTNRELLRRASNLNQLSWDWRYATGHWLCVLVSYHQRDCVSLR